ncbi:hypothetical protein BLS_001825 [Venturia inaequalis]|uniref:Sacsin/Nov domain-containing protein n=1 Tax=Venturia inaequalis TaxID=5025 RepID=A0A8H3VEG1_VENIN|nr:hypothetical protein BLS_001825 [Venturia inaequalis]KAE9987554.1 hypothetical protein EG327_003770 [Venturia inaequalis]
MANPDFARLRETLMDSTADEEAVTVNTRALIDKVLARYSGDWTTLRELIQNAADAAAKNVVITFKTTPSRTVAVPSSNDAADMLKHTLAHHTLECLEVTNDGQAFADSDWNRLKRIAEGNPDETKIGAFGVGFYSVFADCEEPFVVSGRKSMGFVWKGNSLFTKSISLPADSKNEKTSFILNYRSTTAPMPDLMSLCQFLSTSLTFVGLESINLCVDDWTILTLSKVSAPSSAAQLPKGIKTKTKEGLMNITGVVHQSTQIDAKWINAVGWSPSKISQVAPVQDETESTGPSLRSLFSRFKVGAASISTLPSAKRAAQEAEQQRQDLISKNILEQSKASVFLRISTVNIQTTVSANFSKELERATKKPPPRSTRIAILTSSHDETAASLSTVSGYTSDKAPEIFASVLPTKHGRIFIGFPTGQTTGLLCHISTPSIIPTVERESIDLNARYVKTWNIEMLRVAGIACRIAYTGEMEELRNRLSASMKSGNRVALGTADIDGVTPHAVHVFKQYTSIESTPSSQVGKLIEEAFWESSEHNTIDVLSTKGVLPSRKVRVISEPLSFLENIPLIPQTLSTEAQDFVARLYRRGLVKDMNVKDIQEELGNRSLDEAQLIDFLKWCAAQISSKQLDTPTVQGLLEAAVATIDGSDSKSLEFSGGKIMVLSEIKTFLTGSKIAPDLPMPPHTIPIKFTKGITRPQLEAFGWEELQIVPWFRHLIREDESGALLPEHCLTQTPAFAAQALATLSKNWDSMSQGSKKVMIELLSPRTVIPTKLGMRRPTDAYFPSVRLFDDLPVIANLHANIKDKVFAALGVRKTIELTVVFERLMAQSPGGKASPKWSFTDLVQYLVSVQDDIPKQDIERLKTTAICPVEEGQGTERQGGRLYKVSELFEPKEVFRVLGLPVLHWPGAFRTAGPEGKFLIMLGLKERPSVPELVTTMKRAIASSNNQLYLLTMKYFVDHHQINNYANFDLRYIKDEKILTVVGASFPNMATPSACYSNETAAILGYPILARAFQKYGNLFGVASDPPMQQVATRVINHPPTSLLEAIGVFGYLGGRLTQLNAQLAEAFGNARIVPIIGTEEKQMVRHVAPKMCFLGASEMYGGILDFVDFGMEANSFLLSVGSKHEPSSPELARIVIDGPSRILGMLGTDRYMDLLRKLAENQSALKSNKTLWKDLQTSPCLLAYKEHAETAGYKEKESGNLIDFDEDEPTVRSYSLRQASDIVIQDSIKEYLMFRSYISAAPEDDTLEKLYHSLGVPLLSSVVSVDQKVGNLRRDQTEALTIRKRIIERSRLFIHEHTLDLRHDSRWLEKALSVKQVDTIALSTSLKQYGVRPVVEKRTASVSRNAKSDYTLFVTRDPEWYEISTQIVKLLLNRPKQNDTLALESVLNSDLKRLRMKGYNVDRILRVKAYETRLAEEEKRKREDEESKRRDEERKRAAAAGHGTNLVPHAATPTKPNSTKALENETPMPSMPGGFGSDSPDTKPSVKGGIWSNPFFNDALQSVKKGIGMADTPDPKPNQPQIEAGVSGSHGSDDTPPEAQPNQNTTKVDRDPVANDQMTTANLNQAIKAARPHLSDKLFSQPRSSQVAEVQSYCDSTSGKDLSHISATTNGIKIFFPNKTISSSDAFLHSEIPGLEVFSTLLLSVSNLFGLSPTVIHIFHVTDGNTIAFNKAGALFFNYHYFATLHKKNWETSHGSKIDSLAYWYMTLCHELAHNLVVEHSAKHSFYAESFAQQYFGKVMGLALSYD